MSVKRVDSKSKSLLHLMRVTGVYMATRNLSRQRDINAMSESLICYRNQSNDYELEFINPVSASIEKVIESKNNFVFYERGDNSESTQKSDLRRKNWEAAILLWGKVLNLSFPKEVFQILPEKQGDLAITFDKSATITPNFSIRKILAIDIMFSLGVYSLFLQKSLLISLLLFNTFIIYPFYVVNRKKIVVSAVLSGILGASFFVLDFQSNYQNMEWIWSIYLFIQTLIIFSDRISSRYKEVKFLKFIILFNLIIYQFMVDQFFAYVLIFSLVLVYLIHKHNYRQVNSLINILALSAGIFGIYHYMILGQPFYAISFTKPFVLVFLLACLISVFINTLYKINNNFLKVISTPIFCFVYVVLENPGYISREMVTLVFIILISVVLPLVGSSIPRNQISEKTN
jgi:hypothetical protein